MGTVEYPAVDRYSAEIVDSVVFPVDFGIKMRLQQTRIGNIVHGFIERDVFDHLLIAHAR